MPLSGCTVVVFSVKLLFPSSFKTDTLSFLPGSILLISSLRYTSKTNCVSFAGECSLRQYREEVIPGDTLGLKPDVAILNEANKEAFIIDVTMPFEGTESFPETRTAKERKYDHLKALLKSKGYTKIEVDAFIVGPLGSWDTVNDVNCSEKTVHREELLQAILKTLLY